MTTAISAPHAPITRNLVWLFPGQGSQYRGMGSDLFDAYPIVREIYQQASDILGFDLKRLCFEDPQEQLTLTRYTQPALLTHSIACLAAFRSLLSSPLTPAITAGHSLGEYTALVAAGRLTFDQALRLVAQRGALMGEHGEGEMMAFGLGRAQLEPLAEQSYCAIAACNLPDQTVAGGRGEDLDRLAALVAAQDAKAARRSARLKTEGAFHTYYMVKAATLFRADLDATSFAVSDVQVLSNYTGGFHEDDESLVRSRLFYQLFYPVRWLDNLLATTAIANLTVMEFGGGLGSGETPDEKRPNLESIVKKAMKHAAKEDYRYLSAINQRTLEAAAQAISTSQ